jgi:hypothetical protein
MEFRKETRTARIEQLEQVSQNKSAGTGQPAQDSQSRTFCAEARTEQTGQDSQNRSAKTGQKDRTARTVQPGQGKIGQGSQDRTTRM